MKKLFVRWLGVFGDPEKRHISSEMLSFEANTEVEASAEPIDEKHGEYYSHICHEHQYAWIGIAVNRDAVKKQYHYDCWSRVCEDGTLRVTRSGANLSNHQECFISRHSPNWIEGLIVRRPVEELSDKQLSQLEVAYETLVGELGYEIPIYSFSKNGCGKLLNVFVEDTEEVEVKEKHGFYKEASKVTPRRALQRKKGEQKERHFKENGMHFSRTPLTHRCRRPVRRDH